MHRWQMCWCTDVQMHRSTDIDCSGDCWGKVMVSDLVLHTPLDEGHQGRGGVGDLVVRVLISNARGMGSNPTLGHLFLGKIGCLQNIIIFLFIYTLEYVWLAPSVVTRGGGLASLGMNIWLPNTRMWPLPLYVNPEPPFCSSWRRLLRRSWTKLKQSSHLLSDFLFMDCYNFVDTLWMFGTLPLPLNYEIVISACCCWYSSNTWVCY